jgi:SOS response regulatory protein OraA/RecX
MARVSSASALIAHALGLISIRPRTCHEIEVQLTKLCQRRKTAKRATTRSSYADVDCRTAARDSVRELVEGGHLNDESYAVWHSTQRALNRPRSRLALRAELRMRGVDAMLAISESAKVDEYAACTAIARRKCGLSDADLFKHLVRKGFPIHVVQAAIQRRFTNVTENICTEK